jgi:hypothetical protein
MPLIEAPPAEKKARRYGELLAERLDHFAA